MAIEPKLRRSLPNKHPSGNIHHFFPDRMQIENLQDLDPHQNDHAHYEQEKRRISSMPQFPCLFAQTISIIRMNRLGIHLLLRFDDHIASDLDHQFILFLQAQALQTVVDRSSRLIQYDRPICPIWRKQVIILHDNQIQRFFS